MKHEAAVHPWPKAGELPVPVKEMFQPLLGKETAPTATLWVL